MQQAPTITPEQRALWQRAISSPDLLTADEIQELRNEPDLATKNANILKISGLTPEEFINKAEREPKSLTEAESHLILCQFHIRTEREDRDIGWLRLGRSEEDRQLYGAARRAIPDPRMMEIARAVGIIACEKMRVPRVDPAGFKMAPKWVQKVEGLESWGFVAFRGSSVTRSSEEWERYYRAIRGRASLGFVLVGGPINRTKSCDWGDRDVNDSDRAALLQAFGEKRQELKPGFLSNTFLVLDKECAQQFFSKPPPEDYFHPNEKPWVWAYDANFVPDLSISSDSCEETYQGRLRVSVHCLFTWFYAVRESELYTMDQLWEKAQTQPEKAWYVDSIGGAYHMPLVLPVPGENRGVYRMEL